MDLRLLRYFCAVAEELHFGRAAARLNMAQPPLSQQIRKLETSLGVRLFERTNRKVDLTEAGKRFLQRARMILASAEAAATEAQRIDRGEMARLAISFMSAAMLDQFAPILRRFRGVFPDAEIDLMQMPSDEQLRAVAAGQADLGFVDIPDQAEPLVINGRRLRTRTAWRELFVAALSPEHRLANASLLSLRDLAGEAFVTLNGEPATGLHDQFIALCQTSGFTPMVRRQVTQLPVMLTLVAAGYGVAAVPACVHQPWDGLVRFIPLREEASVPVTMVWREDDDAVVLEQFRRAAEESTPELISTATDRAAYLRA